MIITISGPVGEGKTCVANIIRNALDVYRISVEMIAIPFIDHDLAAEFLPERLEVRIAEEQTEAASEERISGEASTAVIPDREKDSTA